MWPYANEGDALRCSLSNIKGPWTLSAPPLPTLSRFHITHCFHITHVPREKLRQQRHRERWRDGDMRAEGLSRDKLGRLQPPEEPSSTQGTYCPQLSVGTSVLSWCMLGSRKVSQCGYSPESDIPVHTKLCPGRFLLQH